MRTTLSTISAALSGLLELAYPPVCRVCQSGEAQERHIVCRSCWRRVERLAELSSNLSAENSPGFTQCAVPEWRRPIVALGEYRSPLAEMIQLFKFSGYTALGSDLGRQLARVAGETLREWGVDCLVPIPLHFVDRKRRGFNQAEILSDILSEEAGPPVARDAVAKLARTGHQSRLSYRERLDNLAGAFAADPLALQGRRVALVDDVVTTGATLREVSDTLRRVGAVVVGAATLASAPENFQIDDEPQTT